MDFKFWWREEWYGVAVALTCLLAVTKVDNDRPLAVITAALWGRIPEIQSKPSPWHHFRLADFKPHRSFWPDWSSLAQGNSSNFHFIHFCLLAGDPWAHPLVKALASCRQLLMKRLFIVTSILSSHICLWLSHFLGYFTCDLYWNKWFFLFVFFFF